MASLIEGYTYDVFISYRQKDNKYDGWVTEFVDHLKKELEATFKEDIGVYFDINPHDGLLETHDVDESLKEKLKCLVFIPVISRTYCDPNSFAWEHEFKDFVKQASQDQFGLKVKLPNGNVANRVLPVQIHDLDTNDTKLCESVLGGVMRGIEFIFKSPGVNRPLLSKEDNPQENLNHTSYRDQINKVANAIKEIITGLKSSDQIGKESLEYGIGEKPIARKNLKTKIIAGCLILLAIVLAAYFILPKLLKPEKQLEKSIAVLPFFNDSPDTENVYFINGVTDEILNNLQKIKDFRVLSRTSIEQYRDHDRPPIPRIAKELNVNYIVEGSGQKYGNQIILRVQLIAAENERHLWAGSYKKEILESSDIFDIHSEIAQSIASELKVILTPEVKRLIENVPTTSLTAYDFYQQGRNEHTSFWIDNNNIEALLKAESFYRKALEYDPKFARAYSSLAWAYYDKNYYKEYLSGNFLDSVLILSDKALSLDNQLAEAYYLRGLYFSENGELKKANIEFDNAIKFNPNDWVAYYGKGNLNLWSLGEPAVAIENFEMAALLNKGPELPVILQQQAYCYIFSGFFNKYNDVSNQWLELTGDSVRYLLGYGQSEYCQCNYEKSIEYMQRGYEIDSTNGNIQSELGFAYATNRQFKESLKYTRKHLESINPLEEFGIQSTHRIGYVYWMNGFKKEANYYFDRQIEISNNAIKSNRPYALNKTAYYDLATVYAFRGEKEKAYENLRIYNESKNVSFALLYFIKNDPLLESLRGEPEFEQIINDQEAKYQTLHEKMRRLLEE